MKAGVRVIGIDDAPFTKYDKKVLVVGVVCRVGVVEGVLSTHVKKDGDDSTEKLVWMIGRSRFCSQIRAVLVNSITLAGFNVIDIERLSKDLGKPVICVTRKMPDKLAAEKAVRNVKNWKGKLGLLRNAGQVNKLGYYAQFAGTDLETAGHIIKVFGIEPLRLAHIIAGGIATGESKGRV